MNQLENAVSRLNNLLAPLPDGGSVGFLAYPPMPGETNFELKSDLLDRARIALSHGHSLLLGADIGDYDFGEVEFSNNVALLGDDNETSEFIKIRDAIRAIAIAAQQAAT